ncbi:phenylalanine--tRNA ligase subunit alpha [Patescibacteria group bacterium AH-259-L07]|nr:phenylalanine--tRNA ligase subunit alpha [Patescibacteria group bacterium AH-259-L07]
MENKIERLQKYALEEIKNAKDKDTLDTIWRKYLGRKDGTLTKILRGIKDLDKDQRPKVGSAANTVRAKIEAHIDMRGKSLRQGQRADKGELLDVTLPGKHIEFGHLHPSTQMRERVAQIFISLGFEILEGNEIVSDYYNFEALNIPQGHPARDMWDTFYIKTRINADQIADQRGYISVNPRSNQRKSALLLRTHTSAMQVKVMEEREPPIRVCVIGKCFRHEATDASHEHTLYQIEGFVVDKHISIANLIYTLKSFLRSLFQTEVKTRLRPSYFPFTEPSFEVDIECLNCNKSGCSACSHSGWMEILGCGMIHPHVFKAAGYPKGAYTGFAFGAGLDRLVMLRHKIDDVRWLHSGDLRFIKQF